MDDICIRYSRPFEYIIKILETLTDKPSIQIHVNRIENRVTFKTKTGYCITLATPETMKLLGSIEKNITKIKNSETWTSLT